MERKLTPDQQSFLDRSTDHHVMGAADALALSLLSYDVTFEEYERLAQGSALLDELCDDHGKYRISQGERSLRKAWAWAEEHHSYEIKLVHPKALGRLRVEIKAADLPERHRKVLLGILDVSEARGGLAKVMASLKVLTEATGIPVPTLNRIILSMEDDLECGGWPLLSVERKEIKSGTAKGHRARVFSLNLAWSRGDSAKISCSHPVKRATTCDDDLSYFRACLSNLALGEWLGTADLLLHAGLEDSRSTARNLKVLLEGCEILRIEGKTRFNTKRFLWARAATAEEEAWLHAEASWAVAAKQQAARELKASVSPCRYVTDNGSGYYCGDHAPPGTWWCPNHKPMMDLLTARPPG